MADTSDNQPRTYSILWFLALFVGLVGLGIWAVIAFGTYEREPTEVLEDPPVTTSPEATTTTSFVPVTMFDGSPAPEGIEQMLGENGKYTYVFSVPVEIRDQATDSVVPPVVIDLADDGASFRITFGCAVSAEAVPAALEVFEDPFEVNVKAVVLGPKFGTPCTGDSDAGSFNIPLESPLGARRLVVARAGQPVELTGDG